MPAGSQGADLELSTAQQRNSTETLDAMHVA
jgi:hypothetical protein